MKITFILGFSSSSEEQEYEWVKHVRMFPFAEYFDRFLNFYNQSTKEKLILNIS